MAGKSPERATITKSCISGLKRNGNCDILTKFKRLKNLQSFINKFECAETWPLD
jgi:hypothetical protein